MMDNHEAYMNRCIQLAELGAGNVAPNPMVGAVLVYDATIIGEGYHKKFGEAHAEVNCIESVSDHNKELIEKSRLYVSLEPCTHFGKTPPCADLIIKNRIPEVIIGCRDVYKEVAGKGIRKLQEAGINVIEGVMENECRELNKRFFTFHTKQRPYIILKWAQSANGKIAPAVQETSGQRIFISNDHSNRLVHKWRSEEHGILVGKQTALKDDPSLTTRLWPGENPVRCVIDNNLTLPLWLKIFDHSTPTLIFNFTKDAEEKNIKWIKLDNGDLTTILYSMYGQKLLSIIVEGGAILLQSFIDAGLWDEARVITNDELIISNGLDAPELKNHKILEEKKYGSDRVSFFEPDL